MRQQCSLWQRPRGPTATKIHNLVEHEDHVLESGWHPSEPRAVGNCSLTIVEWYRSSIFGRALPSASVPVSVIPSSSAHCINWFNAAVLGDAASSTSVCWLLSSPPSVRVLQYNEATINRADPVSTLACQYPRVQRTLRHVPRFCAAQSGSANWRDYRRRSSQSTDCRYCCLQPAQGQSAEQALL